MTAALLSTTWIGCGSGSTSSSAQGSAVEAGAPEADAGSPEAALGSVSDAGDGGDASTCASCLHASGDYRGQPITFACDFTMQTPTSPSHESNIDGAWAIFCFSTDGEKRLSLWFLPEQGPVDSTTGYPDGITLLLTDPLSNDHRLESNATNRVENHIDPVGDIHEVSGTFRAAWSNPGADDDFGTIAFGSVNGTFHVKW